MRFILTCVECKKLLSKDNPVSIHCNDGRKYFFCSSHCRLHWVSLTPEDELVQEQQC